jgi:hypothetical protein
MTENTIYDIFTEPDDSISSDGSIDPMGLRIIWTSIGNRIFGSKLNTISTSVTLYTINLFIHNVIHTFEQKSPQLIAKFTGKQPYDNIEDLRDGLVIFLEGLFAHASLEARENKIGEPIAALPGSSKLNGIKTNNPKHELANFIIADRKGGILVRHILLGIHGRHKGPFREIGIFDQHDYYSNLVLWEKIGALFTRFPNWTSLQTSLHEKLELLLSQKLSSPNPIRLPIDQVGLNENLVLKIKDVLNPATFKDPLIVEFWEEHLGLKIGASGELYSIIKKHNSLRNAGDWEGLIRVCIRDWKGDPTEKEKIVAIQTVEPFLTLIEKVTNRLLLRGTNTLNDPELISFLEQWLNKESIDEQNLKGFLDSYNLNEEPINRLNELFQIYHQSKDSKDVVQFASGLLEFHKKLMTQRGNLPWVSVSATINLTHHRSYNFSARLLGELQTAKWVNNYYLNTLTSLHKGLYTLP